MAFHFTRLEDKGRAFHAIVCADSDEELHTAVSMLPGGCAMKSHHAMTPPPDLDAFLTKTLSGEKIRIRKENFQNAMSLLASEGKKIVDAHAMTLPQFRSAADFVVEKDMHFCADPRELQYGCKAQEIVMSGSLLTRHMISAVIKGIDHRIYETSDYSFYFASAVHESGEIINFLVNAKEQCSITEAIKKYRIPLRKLFQHRLSPDVQAFCSMMNSMRGAPDNVEISPEAQLEPHNDEATFPPKYYRKLLRDLRAEGERIYALHKDTYPPAPPAAAEAALDADEEMSGAWKKTAKALDNERPITLIYEDLQHIVMDMLGCGQAAS